MHHRLPLSGCIASRLRVGDARASLRSALRALALAAGLLALGGCAVLKEFAPRVEAEPLGPGEYIALKRSDILTTDELSPATQATLRVAGLDEGACLAPPTSGCVAALVAAQGLGDERRLAALAELWTQQAITLTPQGSVPVADAQIDAWLEAARHAYAYLFFSERAPGERAFEDRQTQVRDYYNYAVQQAASGLFQRRQDQAGHGTGTTTGAGDALSIAGWTITSDMSGVRMPEGVVLPRELVPASSISFAGLRSIYRRPGGWLGDKSDHFTREGRDTLQNKAFDFLSKLLHWRRGNKVIAKGKMKHYVLQKGVYVYERYLGDESILVFMNGTSNDVEINLDRYGESIQNKTSGKDVISGKTVSFGKTLKLGPKEVIVAEGQTNSPS